MSTSIDTRIQEIFSRTGREVVTAIRAALSEELRNLKPTNGAAPKNGAVKTAPKNGAVKTAPKNGMAAMKTNSAKNAKTKNTDSKRVRRNAEQVNADINKLLGFIRKNPGLRTEHLVQKLDSDPVMVKDGLARLREAGKVKTKGVKRAMVYTAVAAK